MFFRRSRMICAFLIVASVGKIKSSFQKSMERYLPSKCNLRPCKLFISFKCQNLIKNFVNMLAFISLSCFSTQRYFIALWYHFPYKKEDKIFKKWTPHHAMFLPNAWKDFAWFYDRSGGQHETQSSGVMALCKDVMLTRHTSVIGLTEG